MNKSHLKIMFFMFFLACTIPLFAEIVPPGLSKISNEVVNVFSGPLVTGILVACLAGCGVAYGFNKDNEKMKRNIIAIVVAIIIVIAAKEIVSAVMTAAI